MADHRLKTELFDQFARIGAALASGRRIEILDVLANGERGVETLAKEVELSVATTVPAGRPPGWMTCFPR